MARTVCVVLFYIRLSVTIKIDGSHYRLNRFIVTTKHTVGFTECSNDANLEMFILLPLKNALEIS